MRPGVPQGSRVIEAAERREIAHPKVRLVKAALYFEKAHGFGDWHIIVSTGAKKRLQRLANNDRKTCVVVVKKIKYVICLSSFKPRKLTAMTGNFRMDNFLKKIREGLMIPLECRFSRPKYSRIFTLLWVFSCRESDCLFIPRQYHIDVVLDDDGEVGTI